MYSTSTWCTKSQITVSYSSQVIFLQTRRSSISTLQYPSCMIVVGSNTCTVPLTTRLDSTTMIEFTDRGMTPKSPLSMLVTCRCACEEDGENGTQDEESIYGVKDSLLLHRDGIPVHWNVKSCPIRTVQKKCMRVIRMTSFESHVPSVHHGLGSFFEFVFVSSLVHSSRVSIPYYIISH